MGEGHSFYVLLRIENVAEPYPPRPAVVHCSIHQCVWHGASHQSFKFVAGPTRQGPKVPTVTLGPTPAQHALRRVYVRWKRTGVQLCWQLARLHCFHCFAYLQAPCQSAGWCLVAKHQHQLVDLQCDLSTWQRALQVCPGHKGM